MLTDFLDDTLVALAGQATTAQSAEWIAWAFQVATSRDTNRVFGTAPFRDALLRSANAVAFGNRTVVSRGAECCSRKCSIQL